MQKLAEICIRRPVFATMIVLSLVVVGAASFFRLGVDRFPSVDLPTVTVRTSLPGASPEEVETVLAQPIEAAAQDVRDRGAGVVRDLPRDVRPPEVSKADNDSTPVITLALAADRPLR